MPWLKSGLRVEIMPLAHFCQECFAVKAWVAPMPPPWVVRWGRAGSRVSAWTSPRPAARSQPSWRFCCSEPVPAPCGASSLARTGAAARSVRVPSTAPLAHSAAARAPRARADRVSAAAAIASTVAPRGRPGETGPRSRPRRAPHTSPRPPPCLARRSPASSWRHVLRRHLLLEPAEAGRPPRPPPNDQSADGARQVASPDRPWCASRAPAPRIQKEMSQCSNSPCGARPWPPS